jgi:hypothetical protein
MAKTIPCVMAVVILELRGGKLTNIPGVRRTKRKATNNDMYK